MLKLITDGERIGGIVKDAITVPSHQIIIL